MQKVLAVDDFDFVLAGLKDYLAKLDLGIETVKTVKAAKRALTESSYDIAILDYGLSDGNGGDLKLWMNEQNIPTRTLCMSGEFRPTMMLRLMTCGFHGFYDKGDEPEELLAAIESLGDEETFYSTKVLELIDEIDALPQLSERQGQQLNLLHAGLTNQQIADKMKVTDATVSFHMKQLSRKLGATHSRQILTKAREFGLLD